MRASARQERHSQYLMTLMTWTPTMGQPGHYTGTKSANTSRFRRISNGKREEEVAAEGVQPASYER